MFLYMLRIKCHPPAQRNAWASSLVFVLKHSLRTVRISSDFASSLTSSVNKGLVDRQCIMPFRRAQMATVVWNKYSATIVDQDIAVGTATRYGLDGPGIESRWGRDFPHPSRPALWPTQPPTKRVPCLSLEV